MSLFDICIQVLDDASDNGYELNSEPTREYIANEIYDRYYNNRLPVIPDTGYIEDIKDYYSNYDVNYEFVGIDED
jgi:hypothetical protein|tara:strand:- start:1607 stop:1831 length:225 start_codon:yes stop_codon:yes gene_type:complete